MMYRRSFVPVIGLLLGIFIAGSAAAIETGEFADGVLVPFVVFSNTDSKDTVIGVVCLENTGSVYWTYFSANGTPMKSGSLSTVSKRLHALSLGSVAPLWPDSPGYMVITYDDNGTLTTSENRKAVGANAVLLSLGSEDAAYLPCIPLVREDYKDQSIDLANLTSSDLISITNGISSDSIDYVRYWINPAFSAETEIVLWTLESPVGSAQAVIDNGEHAGTIVQLNLTNSRVNIMDVESLWNRPVTYWEGTLSFSNISSDHVIFSFVTSATHEAVQTFSANSLTYP